jgi:hypothetical protein
MSIFFYICFGFSPEHPQAESDLVPTFVWCFRRLWLLQRWKTLVGKHKLIELRPKREMTYYEKELCCVCSVNASVRLTCQQSCSKVSQVEENTVIKVHQSKCFSRKGQVSSQWVGIVPNNPKRFPCCKELLSINVENYVKRLSPHRTQESVTRNTCDLNEYQNKHLIQVQG